MKVYKFGGASVMSAEAVQNVARLVRDQSHENLLIVQSAMGKMTNHLEELWGAYRAEEPTAGLLDEFRAYHTSIADGLELAPEQREGYEALIYQLQDELRKVPEENEALSYDRIVCYGELVGTRLAADALNMLGVNVEWFDVRHALVTDSSHRTAQVDWERSRTGADILRAHFEGNEGSCVLTQGFIARSRMGNTTTLGREGSDYSAAILAYLMDAESVTIWKDVPGMLNADPKWFANTVEVPELSYREAIELSYYGASVIHSKTIKPLQNKEIPLLVKSFLDPTHGGTVIRTDGWSSAPVPMYIFKPEQILLSISPRDFSFIVEHNLRDIFDALNQCGISVNLMQNSAISFSVCFDRDRRRLEALMEMLRSNYELRYNDHMELLTIRHYDEKIVAQLTSGKEILLEQKSRQMIRMVLRDTPQAENE